ncbi:MAG TPA: response regulator, partial [Polyangiaceae bacterium]
DDFMDKPFDTQKLLDKVGQVLAAPRAAAGAPVAQAPIAPAAPAQAAMPSVSARPRSQTLSYGTPAPVPATPSPQPAAANAARTLTGTPAATPKPATVQPVVPAAQALSPAAAVPKPAAPTPAVAAAVAAVGNGELSGQLAALGLTAAQVEGVLALSREVVERVVWEVVPVLAETIIKEEITRLTAG